MSSATANGRGELTLAQRKYLLKVACTCDRLELAIAQAAPATVLSRVVEAAESGPWIDVAGSMLAPFLSRKFRLLLLGARVWRGFRNRMG